MATYTHIEAYFILGGIRLYVTSIEEDTQIQTIRKPYTGGTGSYTRRAGHAGRQITIQAISQAGSIRKILNLRNTTKPLTLVSLSKANYNGLYQLIDLKVTEKKANQFYLTIGLQEYQRPKVTGNMVTPDDLNTNNIGNILLYGNKMALKTVLSRDKTEAGRYCRKRLEQQKDSINQVLKKYPECYRYLKTQQCKMLYREVCAYNATVMKRLYPACARQLKIQ